MNQTRRSFLATALTAAATAPLLGRATKPTVDDYKTIHTGPPPGRLVRVEGLAIKVPSNRWVYPCPEGNAWPMRARYHGDWDGTFRLERGCTNPAYILADLYERTGAEPDWVVAAKAPMTFDHVAFGIDVSSLLKPRLNWSMLYHWGQWCDETAPSGVDLRQQDRPEIWYRGPDYPRFTVNTICRTPEDMVHLRETLRMHCISWQSQAPRYRTSYPGIPYPGVNPPS